jgi:threonine synthase
MSLRLPEHVVGLRCIRCDRLTTDPMEFTCRECGPEGRMDVVFTDDAPARCAERLAERPRDMFRYRELLPLPEGATLPPVSVGWSPVSEAPRLAAHLGVRAAWLKDDGRNPSGSLKDRPSAVGAVLAVAAGAERIACASTGNAASSTACLAASLGLPATIFVPERAPEPKVAQLRIFGATVLRVRADYDTTWDLLQQVASSRASWFNRNCAQNPYLVEGKKTAALELAEQLGERMPAWVSLSVGDGCTIAGVVKGLEQAHAAGLIRHVPRVLGVQAEGAQPLVEAFDAGRDFTPGGADTIADSISVGHPRNGKKALDFVRRNGGRYVAVSDEDILDAMRTQARLGGVFGEPAAAAATAGVKRARELGILGGDDDVAIIVSGNGLKDTATALKAVDGPVDVDPTEDAVLAALDG